MRISGRYYKIIVAKLDAMTKLFFCVANAEQFAAEEYIKIFVSGNFYAKFIDKWVTRILAAKNNMRMEKMDYNFEIGVNIWFNPLAELFRVEDKNPEVILFRKQYSRRSLRE